MSGYSIRRTSDGLMHPESETIDPVEACRSAFQLSLDNLGDSFVVLNQRNDEVATFMRGFLIPTGL